MSVASCFWALLSLDNFDFIYLPDYITDTHIGFGKTAGDILLHHSLLQFIHPEELALARNDLRNFVQIKTLAGAVTRCRLKSIKSIIYGENDNMTLIDWIITDVVMYTATKNTILTFFHSHEIENADQTTTTLPPSDCGQQPFPWQESNMILDILKLHTPPTQLQAPLRIFEIYDTQTGQLIISCPSYDKEEQTFVKRATELTHALTVREMNRQFQQGSHFACTHHAHSTSTAMLEPFGSCNVKTIIITYGTLTFSTFEITPIDTTTSSLETHRKNIIQHSRKSNINDILNDCETSSSASPPPIPSTTKKVANNNTNSPRAWRGRFGVYEKKCENCQTNASPEWRRGPSGHKTLCNACGLRYARLVAKRQSPKEESSLKKTRKL